MSEEASRGESWQSKVARYLESGGSKEMYGLTPRKVYERAEFVRQCPDTGVVVFEMARHQAALGAENRRGSGMHSFVETRRRYTFNPAGTGSIEESSTDTRPKLDLDTHSAADEYARNLDFKFEHLGGRKYRCSESCNNNSWEVSGRREAVELAEAVAEGVCWDYDVECLSLELKPPLSPDMEQEIVNDLHNDFVEIVRGMLECAWDSFMEERRMARRPRKPNSVVSAARSRRASKP